LFFKLLLLLLFLVSKLIKMIRLLIDFDNNYNSYEALNKQIKFCLERKELLVKELNHRTKNNLQLITSLWRVQSEKKNNDNEFNELFQVRLYSLSLIHDLLYKVENSSKVNFKIYLTELVYYFNMAYQDGDKKINTLVECPEVFFDGQIVFNLGLITNEIVFNSYKHAFPSSKSGFIKIHLILEDSINKVSLIIEDNGIPSRVSTVNEGSTFGLQLIQDLVKQINGKLQKSFDSGTRYEIVFTNDFK
jgi:two-component sensor histidine kinase